MGSVSVIFMSSHFVSVLSSVVLYVCTDIGLFTLQVKIRGRSLQCKVCGENATFTRQEFQEFDYEKFTQSPLSSVVELSISCVLFGLNL